MSAKASPAKKDSKSKSKAQSRSGRAGLTFPVGRIGRLLKERKYANRVGRAAPVFIASVLEYLVAELVELAGAAAADAKKKRITPRSLNLAIRGDDEFQQLLQSATISGGGVKPNILKQLQKKEKGHKKRRSSKSKSGSKKKRSKKEKKERKEKKAKSSSKHSKRSSKHSKEGKKKHSSKKSKKGSSSAPAAAATQSA